MKANRNKSFIPINRSFFEHPFWLDERTYSKAEAWLDLIQTARFDVSGAKKLLIGMKAISCERGEIIASVRFLADRWRWSLGKVTRFITLLENERMIERRQVEGQSILKLCNYEAYNPKTGRLEHESEQVAEHSNALQTSVPEEVRNRSGTHNGTGAEQERNEYNKENNLKNVVINGDSAPKYSTEEEKKFEEFKAWINKNAPRVEKMKNPFTIDEYIKLKEKINDRKRVSSLLLKMHNWAPLLKKNLSAYLTILNWNERDSEGAINQVQQDIDSTTQEIYAARQKENQH